jgi:hypothetical protein
MKKDKPLWQSFARSTQRNPPTQQSVKNEQLQENYLHGINAFPQLLDLLTELFQSSAHGIL